MHLPVNSSSSMRENLYLPLPSSLGGQLPKGHSSSTRVSLSLSVQSPKAKITRNGEEGKAPLQKHGKTTETIREKSGRWEQHRQTERAVSRNCSFWLLENRWSYFTQSVSIDIGSFGARFSPILKPLFAFPGLSPLQVLHLWLCRKLAPPAPPSASSLLCFCEEDILGRE